MMKYRNFLRVLKRYPFIKGVVWWPDDDGDSPDWFLSLIIDFVCVRRADKNLLWRIIRTEDHRHVNDDGEGWWLFLKERLYAVLADGTPQEIPVIKEAHRTDTRTGMPNVHQDGHPVIEALRGFEEIQFLVLASMRFDWPTRPNESFEIVIYKPPQNCSIVELIQKADWVNRLIEEREKTD